jgi:hypothetical protein
MSAPTINPAQLVFAGRSAARFTLWGIRISFARSVLVSLALWFASAVALSVGMATAANGPIVRTHTYTCDGPRLINPCVLHSNGVGTPLPLMGEPQTFKMDRPIGTAHIAATGFASLASLTTVIAIATGFLTLVGAFQPSRYQRRGTIRGAVRSDWNASKRDVRRTKKGLKRAGNTMARHRAKQAEHGEANDPSWLASKVLAHADPPKQEKPKKVKAKAEVKELDTEWEDAVREIGLERAARQRAGLPHLDPNDGPPLAPNPNGHDRAEDPMVTAWRDHDAATEARVQVQVAELEHAAHERNGWNGYVPPPAPVAATPISVTEDQP